MNANKRNFSIDLELSNLRSSIEALIKSSRVELYGDSGKWGLTCSSGWTMLSKIPTLIDKWSDTLLNKYASVLSRREVVQIKDYIGTIAEEVKSRTAPDALDFDGSLSHENELIDDIYGTQYPDLVNDFNGRIKLIFQRIDNLYFKQKRLDALKFTVPIILSIIALVVSVASFIFGVIK